MMKVKDWIDRLKYLEQKRVTYYDNFYPSNCGEINADGSISFDCIGMIKSIINEPDIVYKTKPAGYFVKPGQIIPDTSEIGILQLCSDVVWNDFNTCVPGEYIYMPGHAGVFVGEYRDPSGTVNVIECTAAMGGGVLSSYVDGYGNRYDHRGGVYLGHWSAHGKLSRYIDYKGESKKSVDEIAKEVIDGKWGVYPQRKELLEKAGYNYNEIQNKVNDLMKKKKIEEIAKEVIDGKWGVYPKRKELLEKAGYNYNEIQNKVNQLMQK